MVETGREYNAAIPAVLPFSQACTLAIMCQIICQVNTEYFNI